MREIGLGKAANKIITPGDKQQKTERPIGHMEVEGELKDVQQLPEQKDMKSKIRESVNKETSIEKVIKDLPRVVRHKIDESPPRPKLQNVNSKLEKTDFPFFGTGDTQYIQKFAISYQNWAEDYNEEMTVTESFVNWILRKKAEWFDGGAKTGLAKMIADELEKRDVQGGGGKKVNVDRQELANWLETVAINPPLQHDSEKRIEYNQKLSFIAFSLKINKQAAQKWLKAIKKEYDEEHPNKVSEKK